MDDESGGDDLVASVHERILTNVTSFVRDLRNAGVDVPATASIEATRALVVVGFDDFWRARAALRATLLTRPEDEEAFHRLFLRFWEELTATLEASGEGAPSTSEDSESGPEETQSEAPDREEGETVPGENNSDVGGETAGDDWQGETEAPDLGGLQTDAGAGQSTRQHRSVTDESNGGDGSDQVESTVYSQYGDPEPIGIVGFGDAVGLADAVEDLTDSLAELRGWRWTNTQSDGKIDIRRALRGSFSTGGSILEVPRKDQQPSNVRGVILVDVSRSVLDTIDRGFLVKFLRAVHDAWSDVQVFFFDTHVREVSEQFDAPSAGAALAALKRAETEWGGGTRIGHALASLRADNPLAIDRTTNVMVISDGLEVGDVDLLEEEMADLSRRAKRVLWLNPLAAAPNYEPTCRGMAVSLPYVDGLFAFSGPDDVVEMARQLRLRGPGGRVGYEYDARS